MKPLLTFLSIIVIAIIGGGAYILINMDSLAKKVIEQVGAQALGVDVGIDTLEISLQDKKATVQGLKIANPKGFSKPYAMQVDVISVALGQVSKELVVLKDISVSGTDVNLEVKETGTNLFAIKNGMPKPKEKTAATSEGTAATSASSVKVIIDRLAVTKAQLKPSVTLVAAQDLDPVVVPDIVMTGIGEKENGILAQEAIVQIWTQLSEEFGDAAADAGFYQGLAEDTLKKIGAGQIDGIKTKIQDGLNEVGNSLKGLLGN